MKTLKELRQERGQKIDRMKAINDQAGAEDRDLTEEEKTEYEDLKTQVQALLERIERMEETEDLVEENERSQGPVTQATVRKAAAYNKTRLGEPDEARAIASYIRTGNDRELREWRAANNTIANEGTAADGLNAVPTGHYRQIIAKRDESMLANQIGVTRIPGTGLTVNVPTDAETDLAFAATNEQDDSYAQTYERDWPALGTVAMTLLKYTKKIALTEELLEDEDSNLLAFVADFVGRSMAATHNSLLLTELRASGTAGLTLDSASTIGAAEIPELVYKLAGEYADGAVWIMARATEGLIRGLTGNPFLFVPNPAGSDRGRPEIWGYPVYNSTAASAVTASAKSLIFGNMSFVGMREGNGMTFLRDPYTTDGIVYLKYRFRAVYKVLQAEAVQYATHPTA
jgi:HK97 family phage major capsid protein